jgi:hypothetical protein
MRAPSKEAEAYMRQKRIALAEQFVLPKRRIYLDTKFWVLLRDVRLKRVMHDALPALLERVESLVRDGLAICPMNADILFEACKHDDPEILRATAQLLDDLCLGVCIAPMNERINTEVCHFLHTKLGESVHPLNQLVWIKPAYFLGFVTPDMYNLPDEINLEMQKSWADEMWNVSVATVIDFLLQRGGTKKMAATFADISPQLNQGKLDNLHRNKSFNALFLDEIRGMLDVQRADFGELVAGLYEKSTGKKANGTAHELEASGNMVANLIVGAFENNRVTSNELPTLRIGASLHAALRWDRQRKYKANDLFDFRHAEAALPYCDYFLTEHSLGHLLQDGNLDFQRHFACKVYSDPAEAIEALTI